MTPDCQKGTFGTLLREWRRNNHLNQSSFGELLSPKVRHSTVSRWESGHRSPSGRFLRQIVQITGISPSVALGIQSDNPDHESA